MPTRRSVVCGALVPVGLLAAGQSVSQVDHSSRLHLRFTGTLRNPGMISLRNQVLWIYMPVRETATQRLERLKVSLPFEEVTDALGHCIAKIALSELPALASKLVAIDAGVTVRSERKQLPLENSAAWLSSERFIETEDAGIVALALQLRRETPALTANAIYDWLRLNLRYAGYIADDLGAREALSRRSGDCTEYACLAVALARANGIPARMVGGYVCATSVAPRAEDYHNWAEVHIDGAWRVLDAQKECWNRGASEYIAFRFYRGQAINQVGLAHRFRIDGEMHVRL